MTFDEFMAVCDRFTNKRLFVTDRHGELVRDDRDGAHEDQRRQRRAELSSCMAAQRVAIVDYGHVQSRLGARARSRRSARGPTSTDEPGDLDARRPHRAARRRRVPRRDAQPAGARRSTRRSPSRCCDEGAPFLGVCLGMQLMARGRRGGASRPRASAGSTPACVRFVADRGRSPRPARRLERGDAARSTRRCSTASRRGTDFYFVHSFHVRAAPTRRTCRDHAVLRRLHVGRAATGQRSSACSSIPRRASSAASGC